MSVNSLGSVITGSLLNGFINLGSKSASSANAVTKASTDAVSQGLSYGSQVYGVAAQTLNTVSSFFTLAEDSLKKLSKLTDKLINITERAAQSGTGEETRRKLQSDFDDLVSDFRKIASSTTSGDLNALDATDLGTVLLNVGLSAEDSSSVASIIKKFEHPFGDDALASEETKGKRPADIPPSAFYTAWGKKVFSSEEPDQLLDAIITKRPDAYRTVGDLKALNTQIKDNLKALDYGKQIIGDNIQLVRATQLSMRQLANQSNLPSDMTELANQLQKTIRENSTQAMLAQAENLPIIAAKTVALLAD